MTFWRIAWTLTALAAVTGLLLIAGQLHVANCQRDHRENCGMVTQGDVQSEGERVYCWTREIQGDSFFKDDRPETQDCVALP